MNEGPIKSSHDADECGEWEYFATAVRFLTRVPVPGPSDLPQATAMELLRGSVCYFPIIGGLIGVATSLVMLTLLWIGASPLLAALLAIGFEVILTGAFHEDAFADTCDGLGGGWTREKILEIMKDSRLGTYGAIALVVGVGSRAEAMATIGIQGAAWTFTSFAAASAIGRMAILWLMSTTQPIANGKSLAKDISGVQSGRSLLGAIIISIPFWIGWILIRPGTAVIGFAAAFVCLFCFRQKIIATLGGTTGDILGCSAFLTQLVVLIGASLR